MYAPSCKCITYDCLKLSHQWTLHVSHLPDQMQIKRGCVACCMLCFKPGGDLLCTAFGCNDSKLEILHSPFNSCCDAVRDGFDQVQSFYPDMTARHTQPIVALATLLRCKPHACWCRQWGLILGVVILAFGLLPSFRSVRLLNIIALCGTNYSCLYFFIYAAKHGIQLGAFTRYTAATRALVACPKCPH